MTYLLLVRHSLPEIIPELPARQWLLSEEGRQRCRPLAEKAAPYAPAAVISSIEPKAQETAAIIANHLHLPLETVAGLHEHERENVPFSDRAAFRQQVAAFFHQPEALVFGQETAVQARERYTAAVNGVLARYPQQTVVIVSHGTVMTLFVAAQATIDPLAFWQALALPDLVVLKRPDLTLQSGLY